MTFVGPFGRGGLSVRRREVRRKFGFEDGVLAPLLGEVLNVIKSCQSGLLTNETLVLYMELCDWRVAGITVFFRPHVTPDRTIN